ncbi:serine/threonine-protein kinase Nek3-like isoform X1 [Scylla paramamosain]|uniref:serine/threonine-protein kinase Nek3-like isoform X1 n=2 Tax=Scylla paramamosain TaxID=85552 RepID=UPI0030839DCC
MEVDKGARFRKVANIGRGTFGEAWLVVSTCSRRRYVMKEVRLEDLPAEEVEKTRQEAEVLARCKHASIVRYKECFVRPTPLTMCLVMEYAGGGDLSQRVSEARRRGQQLAEDVVLDWFSQIILAVQYLHSNNILHRDLKTQNIFLTADNLVKVGDFGIARLLRDRQDLATTTIGTPFYLSPEICLRRPYNHKSDMWAVGCVLYELCALRQPFQDASFDRLVMKILEGEYEPLPASYTPLVHHLTKLLLRTIPERRPSAAALLTTPGLTPYVQGYLSRYEVSLAERGTESKESPVPPGPSSPLKPQEVRMLQDPPHLARIKDSARTRRQRGSVDLGSIQSVQRGKERGLKRNRKGEERERAYSDSTLPTFPPSPLTPSPPLTPNPRFPIPPALSALPVPSTSLNCGAGDSGGGFASPLPCLPCKRADTPWPKVKKNLLR